jgi:hypothetical protein
LLSRSATFSKSCATLSCVARWILGLLVLVTASVTLASESSWVQYGPGGLEARVLTEGPKCPSLSIDGRSLLMTLRAPPHDQFPNRVCALALPKGVTSVKLGQVNLPLPRAIPQRILLIGDTGCKFEWPKGQDCHEADQWPFQLSSEYGAKLKPDLVIHLGDLHYRRPGCKALADCGKIRSGDTADVWDTDFFEPARALLAAAPFVFVRGNHEMCETGGIGWSRALDPYPNPSGDGCLAPAKPFTIDLGHLTLVVMDVSIAADDHADRAEVEWFRQQFASLPKLAPKGPVWLAFHRPIWAAAATVLGVPFGYNKTLAEAAKGMLPANVDAFLSGHQHTFQVLNYVEDLPVQIVSGHGGAALHRLAPSDPTGLAINGVHVKAGLGTPGRFGFAMLERTSEGWSIKNYATNGEVLASCRFQGRSLDCD